MALTKRSCLLYSATLLILLTGGNLNALGMSSPSTTGTSNAGGKRVEILFHSDGRMPQGSETVSACNDVCCLFITGSHVTITAPPGSHVHLATNVPSGGHQFTEQTADVPQSGTVSMDAPPGATTYSVNVYR